MAIHHLTFDELLAVARSPGHAWGDDIVLVDLDGDEEARGRRGRRDDRTRSLAS